MIALVVVGFWIYCAVLAVNGIAKKNRKSQEQLRLEQIRIAKEQERQAKEQERLAKEQAKQAKEQERQAAQLAKHEKRLADLEFKRKQADEDIAHWEAQFNALCALLDREILEQAGAVPGSKTDLKCQKRIITLSNQIHSADAKLSRAKHIKEMAEKELSAA